MQPIIDELIEQWRRRQTWHSAEKKLTLQCKAICRRISDGKTTEAQALYKSALNGGEHPLAAAALALMLPLSTARDGIEVQRKQVEKRLKELARQLPMWKALQERGLGVAELGLASIIGEAGDLNNYSTVAKLWKRMGLAVMHGQRQRLVANDAAAAIEHGYNPRRRSVVWVIGDSIIKVGGPLREVYDERKKYLIERAAQRGQEVVPAASLKSKKDKEKFVSVGHIHNDAKRYMEKRLLRTLWQIWRGDETIYVVQPERYLSPSAPAPDHAAA